MVVEQLHIFPPFTLRKFKLCQFLQLHERREFSNWALNDTPAPFQHNQGMECAFPASLPYLSLQPFLPAGPNSPKRECSHTTVTRKSSLGCRHEQRRDPESQSCILKPKVTKSTRPWNEAGAAHKQG